MVVNGGKRNQQTIGGYVVSHVTGSCACDRVCWVAASPSGISLYLYDPPYNTPRLRTGRFYNSRTNLYVSSSSLTMIPVPWLLFLILFPFTAMVTVVINNPATSNNLINFVQDQIRAIHVARGELRLIGPAQAQLRRLLHSRYQRALLKAAVNLPNSTIFPKNSSLRTPTRGGARAWLRFQLSEDPQIHKNTRKPRQLCRDEPKG